MQKSYLYAAAGLAFTAAVAAGLMVWSEKRKPVKPEANEPQGLNKPRGLAFGPDGDLWVADSRNHRLVKQKPDGSVEKRLGRQGIRDGEFREPCDLKVGRDGNLYVADTFYTLDANGGLPWGRVQKLTSQGLFVMGWSKSGSAPSDFFGPRAIALDSKNFVYLSDTGNHRILKYDMNGAFLKSWGGRGTRQGQFQEPFGLAFDARDHLYVCDRLNFRVQVFDDDGEFLRQFKVNAWEESQINQEPYLAIDNQRGWVWISDPTKSKVHRYSTAGAWQKTYDQGLEGALNQPTGLAVRASDGMLFVSDGVLARILTIKP